MFGRRSFFPFFLELEGDTVFYILGRVAWALRGEVRSVAESCPLTAHQTLGRGAAALHPAEWRCAVKLTAGGAKCSVVQWSGGVPGGRVLSTDQTAQWGWRGMGGEWDALQRGGVVC